MTSTTTIHDLLQKQDYCQTITDILVRYLCSHEFHAEEEEVRLYIARHVWNCYDQLWAGN